MLKFRFPLVLLLALALFGALTLQPPAALSQGTGTPRLIITDFQSAKFPQLSAQVSVLDENGHMVDGLDSSAFTVQEDGAELKPTVASTTVGEALVIIFDTSRNTIDPNMPNSTGATGKLLFDEMKTATLRLLDSTVRPWLDTTGFKDQIMILAFVGSTVKAVSPFSTDYGYLYNQVNVEFRPSPQDASVNTPILDAAEQALQGFQLMPGMKTMRKAVLIFSDGTDIVSPVDRERAGAAAQQAGIPIYTVQLGANPSRDSIVNLQGLAEASGGQYYHYDSEGSLDSLYDTILSQKKQYVLTFQSKANTKAQHNIQITARIGNANPVPVMAERSYSIDIENPQVEIVSPATGQHFERDWPSWDSKPQDAMPKTIPVKLNFTFPDGIQRAITKVEYSLDGKAGLPITKAPFDHFDLDISGLDKQDEYYLQVTVTDALGLVAQSDPLPIAIDIKIPAAPTPVPTPTLTPQQQIFGTTHTPGYLTIYGPWVLAVIAILIAIIVALRKPQIVASAGRQIVEKVREATEPFLPQRHREERKGRAYLQVLAGVDGGQSQIELLTENTRLGRDEGLVTVVFADKSVSRWHASIKEESNGEFRIYDEGSKSGTYVNEEQVPMIGQRLEEGDIIELGGRVRMKFHLRGATGSGAGIAASRDGDDNSTTPMEDLESEPAAPAQEEDDNTTPFTGRDVPSSDSLRGDGKPPRHNTDKL